MSATATLRECSTQAFRLPVGRMMQFIMLRHCLLLLTVVILVGLGLFVFGFVADLRLTLIGLMIWCIILPGTMAFCYFKYGLQTVSALNSVKHILRFTAEGIEYESCPETLAETEVEEARSEAAESAKNMQTTNESKGGNNAVRDAENAEFRPVKRYYPFSSMGKTEAFGGGLFVSVDDGGNGTGGYLFIPFASGEKDEAYEENLRLLAVMR